MVLLAYQTAVLLAPQQAYPAVFLLAFRMVFQKASREDHPGGCPVVRTQAPALAPVQAPVQAPALAPVQVRALVPVLVRAQVRAQVRALAP